MFKAQKASATKKKRHIRAVLKESTGSATMAGLCVSVAWAVTPCKLFLRHLYRLLPTRSSWDDIIYLNSDCIQEFHWWLEAMDD